MDSSIEDIIPEVVEIIKREANPTRIVLFGSRVRNESQENSDIDLLVIQDNSNVKQQSRRKKMAQLTRELSKFSIPTDILLYSQEEVDTWCNSINHIIARALREGKDLYVRS